MMNETNMTPVRSQNHLAELLGISKSAASVQARRGMPITSLEEAQAWRDANLSPAHRKGVRFDRNYRPPEPSHDTTLPTLAGQANGLMDAVALRLEEGLAVDSLLPGLLTALRLVPPTDRDIVAFPSDVAYRLIEHLDPGHLSDVGKTRIT